MKPRDSSRLLTIVNLLRSMRPMNRPLRWLRASLLRCRQTPETQVAKPSSKHELIQPRNCTGQTTKANYQWVH